MVKIYCFILSYTVLWNVYLAVFKRRPFLSMSRICHGEADELINSCDLMSRKHDEQNRYATSFCSLTSNEDLVAGKSRAKNHSEVEILNEQFDSIVLSQRTQRYNDTKLLEDNFVDIDGSPVQVRGPCIDVKTVFRKDNDGDTLLHTALIIPVPEVALYFIDMSPHASWLNVKNKISQTPLHLAVLTNQVSLVRRLIVAGADIEARDKDGNMAIHIACRENLIGILRTLLEPVRYEEQKRNNYDIPFLKVPQNLDIKNYEGYSCLHIAAFLNHCEIIETLLEAGANINIKAEKSGRTVLHEAAWSGNLKLVKLLISHGHLCDINAKTYDGYTAFDFARSRGHWSIVIELAAAGAKNFDEECS